MFPETRKEERGWVGLEMGPRIGTWGARIKQGRSLKNLRRTYPVAQWLRPPASSAGGSDPIAGWGTKISHAAAKNKKQKWNNFRQISERMALRLLDPEGMCPSPVQRLILTQRDSLPGLASLPPAPPGTHGREAEQDRKGKREFGSRAPCLGQVKSSRKAISSFVYSFEILLRSTCVLPCPKTARQQPRKGTEMPASWSLQSRTGDRQ